LTCKRTIVLIPDYLSNRLNPEIRAAFNRHLEHCEDCVPFLKTYEKTIEVTRSFLANLAAEFPARLLTLRPEQRPSPAAVIFWLHLFLSFSYLTA